MKYNPFLNLQGQSLTSFLADNEIDAISVSLASTAAKYPRVRKFRPQREFLPASVRAR